MPEDSVKNNNKNQKEHESINRKELSIRYQMALVSIGLVFGILISLYMHCGDYEILYISQDELIELEKHRLEEKVDSKDLELFYGEVAKSISLIEEIAKTYESSSRRVVFSRGPVNGNNVRSISKEVHTKLLEALACELKEAKTDEKS